VIQITEVPLGHQREVGSKGQQGAASGSERHQQQQQQDQCRSLKNEVLKITFCTSLVNMPMNIQLRQAAAAEASKQTRISSNSSDCCSSNSSVWS